MSRVGLESTVPLFEGAKTLLASGHADHPICWENRQAYFYSVLNTLGQSVRTELKLFERRFSPNFLALCRSTWKTGRSTFHNCPIIFVHNL
jgi:hypothetical protein